MSWADYPGPWEGSKSCQGMYMYSKTESKCCYDESGYDYESGSSKGCQGWYDGGQNDTHHQLTSQHHLHRDQVRRIPDKPKASP